VHVHVHVHVVVATNGGAGCAGEVAALQPPSASAIKRERPNVRDPEIVALKVLLVQAVEMLALIVDEHEHLTRARARTTSNSEPRVRDR
jgi:hypothetical protein